MTGLGLQPEFANVIRITRFSRPDGPVRRPVGAQTEQTRHALHLLPDRRRFSAAFGYRDYLQAVAGLRTRGATKPLSPYLHIPFCDTVCYYCACNKIVTKNRDKATVYLSYLKREIDMQGALFAGINRVEQLHFGGGTPTYL